MLPFNATSVVKLTPIGSKLPKQKADKSPTSPVKTGVSPPSLETVAEVADTSISESADVVEKDKKMDNEDEVAPLDSPSSVDNYPESGYNYYNTDGEDTQSRHNYYNTDGEDNPITLTSNDYETMYIMKRNLEELKHTNNSTLEKINNIMVDEEALSSSYGDGEMWMHPK